MLAFRRLRDLYKVPVAVSRVEQVLGWAPGSVDAIARGGQPTPAPPVNDRQIEAMWRAVEESSTLDEETREAMRQLLRRQAPPPDRLGRRHA